MIGDIGPRLLCDGTVDGLLTALYYAEAMRPRPSAILLAPPAQTDLLPAPTPLVTEPDKAQRVYRAVRQKLPGDSWWVFQSVYASNCEQRGTLLMRYLRVGWRAGRKLNDHIANPDVLAAVELSRKVGCEVHRLLGLARFALIGDVYYCSLSPDHDVLTFMAPHFADRLGDQSFIMHDITREKAVVYSGGKRQWTILPLSSQMPSHSDPYEDLWRAYHSAISIQSRENAALQRQHMPRRYWQHLPEMSGK